MRKRALSNRIDQLELALSNFDDIAESLASITNRIVALEQVHMALYRHYGPSHSHSAVLQIPEPYIEVRQDEKERT